MSGIARTVTARSMIDIGRKTCKTQPTEAAVYDGGGASLMDGRMPATFASKKRCILSATLH